MNRLPEHAMIRPIALSSLTQVIARMSTRRGAADDSPYDMNLSYAVGDAKERVDTNRSLFFGSCGIRLDELAVPRQIHSTIVRVIDSPGVYPDCDGLVTSAPRVFLCVTVADCVPILLVDPVNHVAAAVHAGWRGTAGGILRDALAVMTERFGSNVSTIAAFLGPAAGECCYQVGEDVAARFSARHVTKREGWVSVDLKGANRSQLLDLGVPDSSIEVHPACTISDGETFHSYRREKDRSGRMMAVVGFSS